jgi:hypothetical protein
MMPKYGVTAATRSVVGNIWLAPVLLAFPGIVLLESSQKPPTVDRVLAWILIGIAALCTAMAVYRILTATASYRRLRKSGLG